MSEEAQPSYRAFLLGTTSMHPADRGRAVIEGLIMHSRDVLRWLYYKETGQDLGIHVQLPSRRQELNDHYLTHLWGQGGDLTKKLSVYTDDEQMELKSRLTKILMWAKPFLDYMRAHGLSAQR